MLENLALSCVSCSLRKGGRSEARDPATNQVVVLFHPRRDVWEEHFEVSPELYIVGRTPVGRAMVELLQMNRPVAVEIRREEALRGRFP